MSCAKNSEQRDLFRDALEMMVLQCLRHQPMHGYVLVQYIQQRSEELLHVEEGSLCPALQRMMKEGLVKAEWKISPSNRRVRNYRITSPLREVLSP
jgi:PadR family transcriptional regulator, regulatory protein PadR